MPETTAKTPKHLSPAGEASPPFPEELILEILLRVPVRSLVRFRCVSKSWKTLISHPQFVKDHLRFSTTHPNMAHQQLASSVSGESHKIASFNVQSLLRNHLPPYNAYCLETYVEYHIIGSCNGLLCLTDPHENYVTLCNPSMCLVSERLPLGFLPCVIFLGFGYDHVNDKYKLLGTSKLSRDDETVTKIYTFGADSWTVIPNFPRNPVQWRGKFVSGTLNWLSERGLNDDQWLIFFLDLATETYGEMVLRDGDRKTVFCPLLSVLRDCLCLSFYDTKKSHSVVWLMKDYGVEDSWTKLMIIPHHDPLLWPPFFEPLCISQDGVVLLKTRSCKLVRYNSNDGRLYYLGIRGNHWWDLRIYHESLVPLPC